MKIALFGGSFDPPHIGHSAVIQTALDELKCDKIIVMPTWLSPFKTGACAPAFLRLLWAKKSWETQRVHVSDFEVSQQRSVSSYESVMHLKKLYNPEHFYLIIGYDHLSTLNQWHNFDKLRNEVEFVVATREGNCAKGLKNLAINVSISSSKLRQHMEASYLPEAVRAQVFEYYQTRILMENRIERIVALLDEKKAENIQVFDMEGKDYFVNSVIIATTLGERHGTSLLEELKEKLKPKGEKFLHVDPASEWVVIDLGDILIHLMTPEYRARYNLEEFLSDFEKARI
jgi:nicotinate-nucleotide adenylyltransferase